MSVCVDSRRKRHSVTAIPAARPRRLALQIRTAPANSAGFGGDLSGFRFYIVFFAQENFK